MKKLIKSLKNTYNVFHAPTKNIKYYDTEKSNKVLKKIRKLYSDLNCKTVIFHYNNFKDPNYVLKKLKGINVCIANLDNRRSEQDYIENMKVFFEKYPKFVFCLDICHALEHSRKDLLELKMLSF